jgi:hypothetical protein
VSSVADFGVVINIEPSQSGVTATPPIRLHYLARVHFLAAASLQQNATGRATPLSHRLQWGENPRQKDKEDCMGDIGPVGVWVFLSIGAVALFGVFLPVVTWIDSQRKEREAFYQAETFRRLAESSGEGAKAAIELMREQTRQKRLKQREGMKISGLINIGLGAGLCIFLRVLTGPGGPWLSGLIPGFIGVALLTYVLFFAAPVDKA